MNPKMPSRDNSYHPSSNVEDSSNSPFPLGAAPGIDILRKIGNAFGFLGLAAWALLLAQPAVAQRVVVQQATANNPQSLQAAQSFRDNFSALLDNYNAVFKLQGNTLRQEQVAQAQAAMQKVSPADLAYVFSRGSLPDLAPAVSAMQRVAAAQLAANNTAHTSSTTLSLAPGAQPGTKSVSSVPFPDPSTSVIDDCSESNTPHGAQLTYDALISAQETSSILAAAAWVCNEDILGENGSAVCIPFAIANDIAQSLFAARNFCSGLDQSAMVAGNSSRLDHIHTDLSNDLTTLQGNITTATTTITTNDNSNKTAIVTNDNTNTTSIIASIGAGSTTVVNNANANTTQIIKNDNANTTTITTNNNNNKTAIVANDNANTTKITTNDNNNKTAIVTNDNANTATITTNDNNNKTAIVTNDNTNTTSIIASIGAGTTTVVNNANANTTQIINNDNANTATIAAKVDADMSNLRDLTLRTWIELALAANQGYDVVSLQVPQAFGGHLELVRTITTQVIASVQASGGKIGNAQSQLAAGDAALAAHQYQTAFKNYKHAYRSVSGN